LLVGEGGFGVVGGEVLVEELGEGLGGFEIGAGLGVGGEGLLEGGLVGGGEGFAESVGGQIFGVHGMERGMRD
jgi:hypothetical protein